jgi:PTS system mannose-specific IIA component
MLGIVLASHGNLADGIIDAAKLIIGDIKNVRSVSLKLGEDIDLLGSKIEKAINEVDQGQGVIVLVDLPGASPYNQTILSVSRLNDLLRNELYVLTGVNLPMFIEAINQQMIGSSSKDAISQIKKVAFNGVDLWSFKESQKHIDSDEDDF